MDALRALALQSNSLLIDVFHKEALFIFVVFCLMMFALAAILAKWAYDSGEFNGLEESKFQVLED